MKVVLFALGSRGDIEPLFAIGEVCKNKGWHVVYVFPEQFRENIPSEDTFYGFTSAFLENLVLGDEAKTITSRETSWFKRMKALIFLGKKSISINKEANRQQKEVIEKENPDYIFFNQKCVLPIIWGMQNPGKSIFVHPFPCFMHKVKTQSIMSFNGSANRGVMLNSLGYFVQSLSYAIGVYFSTKNHTSKRFRANPFNIRRALLSEIKSFYTVSPSLFARPNYWPNVAQVVGHFERATDANWKPGDRLKQFMENHQRIIFITFGSISNLNPDTKTHTILRVLKKHKIAAIINTSWGGLSEPEQYPNHVHFVNYIPYNWIFPKVYAVIHHGGSGTTHNALKHGCASLIVPHFIDQFYWNDRITALKLGPKGIPIGRLNEQNFEKLLLELINTKEYKVNAETVARKMAVESNIDNLMELTLQ